MTTQQTQKPWNRDTLSLYLMWSQTLGWLWSPPGMLFIALSAYGMSHAPKMLYEGIYNDPMIVTPDLIDEIEDGKAVMINGSVDASSARSLPLGASGEKHTIALLSNAKSRVVIYYSREVDDASLRNRGKHLLIGTLYRDRPASPEHSATGTEIRRAFASSNLFLPVPCFVISEGKIPDYNIPLIIGFCASVVCFAYVGAKINMALHYMLDRDAFLKKYGPRLNGRS